jgi:hypothetical protein
MAVTKRPAPKRLTKPERLAILLEKRLPSSYDVQRLEWLKVIAEEREILEPRQGLYKAANDWLFELAYALAVERYDGSGKGRPSGSPKDDLALVFKVREMRMKHPNESRRKIAARILGISPKKISKKEHPENYKEVDTLCKRYTKAEARLADKFTK